MNLFVKAHDDFRLKISTTKTEVIYQTAQAAPQTDFHIIINSKQLAAAGKFT